MAGIKLVSSYDRGQTGSAALIIMLTVLVEALAIGVNVGGYVVFGDETCGSSLWVNVTGSVVLALLPLLQYL